ncbi:SDR family NAD(P)-dependent oxidoreductase [uncultured Tessaracoccus sp.]|uniref:SDR family NAD(P)-dependent oxidoreductase n=1 Tax=uncultured Tessaracoccus sp. TaxID=905023 RepID=UPI00261C3E78|nr:SDR family oxidoreductase [uncultured Tessaracoccus sp.]
MIFPEERAAVVTGVGAPSGIGRRIARRLLEDGFDVAVGDIQFDNVDSFVEEVRGEFPKRKIVGLHLDVADEASVVAAFEKVDTELPQLVALVNPAGIACPETLLDISVADFDKVFAVNCRGTFLMMRHAFARMKQHGIGRIVNFSSITAFDGGGTFSKGIYAGAKAGIIGLTRGGAREFGPSGVTVNVIAPGPIDTEIMGGKLTDDRKATMSSNIPLQRVGQPEEIASVCSFLVSEDSSFVNGTVLNADGGKHMR